MIGSTRRRTGVAAGALALLVALSGCALVHPGHGHGQQGAPKPRKPVSLEVQNQDFNDADIFTVIAGESTQLGTVTGETTGHFTFPWTIQDVSLAIHLIGGGGYMTRSIAVDPGDSLLLILQPGMYRLGTQ